MRGGCDDVGAPDKPFHAVLRVSSIHVVVGIGIWMRGEERSGNKIITKNKNLAVPFAFFFSGLSPDPR